MYRLDFVKKNNFDMVLTQFSDFSLNRGPGRGPGPGPRSKVPRPGVTLILEEKIGFFSDFWLKYHQIPTK